MSLTPFVRVAGLYVLLPIMIAFTMWLLVGHALPDLFTRFAGSAYRNSFELRKSQVDSDDSCDYRIYGEPFDTASRGYYCAGQSEWKRLPAQGVMEIRAHRTWFGTHVDRIVPVEPTFH